MRFRLAAALGVLALFGLLTAQKSRTAPPSSFHFCILGDRTGKTLPGVYERAWREVALLHPAFVTNVGDTIQGGSDRSAEREWKEAEAIWTPYHVPFFIVPGNHDIFSKQSREMFQRETGHPAHYGFNYEGAHFTVLDTAQSDDFSESELSFLTHDLAENRSKSPKMVLFHKPFWLLNALMKNRDYPLHKIAKEYGVCCIISGHGHQLIRLVNDGVLYMEIGSSGAHFHKQPEFEPDFSHGAFFHFVWASVNGANAQFTIKELEPPYGKGRMFDANEWNEKGPAFNPEDPATVAK